MPLGNVMHKASLKVPHKPDLRHDQDSVMVPSAFGSTTFAP